MDMTKEFTEFCQAMADDTGLDIETVKHMDVAIVAFTAQVCMSQVGA